MTVYLTAYIVMSLLLILWLMKKYTLIHRAPGISKDDLLEMSTDGILWIDVRSTRECERHDVPGAQNIPFEDIFQLQEDSDRDIVLFCNSGIRASKAAGDLLGAGYTKVRFYAGSYRDLEGILPKVIST